MAAAPSAVIVPTGPPTDLADAWVDFLGNGNLAVVRGSNLHLFDGKAWKERSWPSETGISVERTYGSDQASLVVGGKNGWSSRYDSVELLSPVDLTSVYLGHGRVVDGVLAVPNLKPNGEAPGVKDSLDDRAVVLEHGGRLVTLLLPPGHGKEVTALRLRAADDLAIVTWQSDSQPHADAYVLSTGKRIGTGVPHDSMSPIETLLGHVQYYVALVPAPAPAPTSHGSSSSMPPASMMDTLAMPTPAVGYEEGSPRRALVVRDVFTGTVLKQRVIPCKGMLANPTVSPDGNTVLVTCGGTAIVMDGRTLAEKRRVGSVIPGCDNGFDLGGHIESGTPATLVIEGCGGVARLNLGTGRFVCGDNAGVMGGPYLAMDTTTKFTPPKVPACTVAEETSHQTLGTRGLYTYLMDDKVVRGPGATTIQLEPDSSMPALSLAEDRMAYVNDKKIVVRELPSGKVLDLLGKWTLPSARLSWSTCKLHCSMRSASSSSKTS